MKNENHRNDSTVLIQKTKIYTYYIPVQYIIHHTRCRCLIIIIVKRYLFSNYKNNNYNICCYRNLIRSATYVPVHHYNIYMYLRKRCYRASFPRYTFYRFRVVIFVPEKLSILLSIKNINKSRYGYSLFLIFDLDSGFVTVIVIVKSSVYVVHCYRKVFFFFPYTNVIIISAILITSAEFFGMRRQLVQYVVLYTQHSTRSFTY